MTEIFRDKSLIFYLLLVVSLILTRIPVIGKYFRLVSTLIHEAAHAFTALLFSGEVISINLFNDTSGNTVTRSKSKFGQFMVSFSGYPLTSLASVLFLLLVSRNQGLFVLFIMASLTLVLAVLSIRNTYGIFWAISFIVLNLVLIYFNEPLINYPVSVFYTMIIFCDAIFSSFIILGMSFKTPKKAGDATNLQKTTGVPAGFWGMVFVAIALGSAYTGIRHYFLPLPF